MMPKHAWLLPWLTFATACGDCSSAVGNRAPTLDDVALSTAEDTPLAVSVPAVDPDGNTVTYDVTAPAHGTLTGQAPSLTYTPATNFVGDDSFEVTVSDGTLSTVATVTITVTPVNDAPLAADDAASTDKNVAVVIPAATLLANDTDVEGTTLTITSAQDAVDGTVSFDGTAITFTPNTGFSGQASFGYTVSDGELTASAVVNVTVNATNEAPVAQDDTGTTDEDTAVTFTTADLVANDTDVDGDTLTLLSVANATHGTATLDGSGNVEFVPEPNYAGDASFEYTVSDGALTASAIVHLTVNPVHDAPIAAADDTYGDEDLLLFIDPPTLLGNDTNLDGAFLTLVSVQNAVHGSVSFDGTTVVFTPDPNFNGDASFEYTVSDGTLTADGAVTVHLGAVNDAPVAQADALDGFEDTAVVVMADALLANDSDAEADPLVVTSVGNAANGTVALSGGMVTFTPAPDFNGVASFDYVVSDGSLDTTGTVVITLAAVNDAPVAVDDTATVTNDQSLLVAVDTLIANDTDVDLDPLFVTAVWGAVHGTVSLSAGTVTFTPESGYAGAASFGYTVSDGVDTAMGQVTITVVQSNRAPVAANQFFDLRVNTSVGITLAATDADSDPLTYSIVSGPSHGTLTGSGAVYTYTPTVGYVGTDSFVFRANDGTVDSNDATVSITLSTPVCGDGVTDAAEACDDGNKTAGDGCRADCTGVEVCGDGIVDSIIGEQCDDGNVADGDGCTSACLLPPFTAIAPVVISGSLSCNTSSSNTGRKAAVDQLGRFYVAMNCGGTGYVSVSPDRGLTWPGPVSTGITGVQAIAVEGGPTGTAYVVAKTTANTVVFTRTTDGGLTWEPATTLRTGVTDAEVSVDSFGDAVYVLVSANSSTLALMRNFSRGVGTFDSLTIAQSNVFHEVVVDRISGNIIAGSDNPAFRVRISSDQGSTFGAESNPPGGAYFSDWAGSNGYLYVTGTNGDNNIDVIPLSSPGTSTQVVGLPTNISAASVRSIDADALGNAYVVSQLTTGNVQLDRMLVAATSILATDARTIATGTFPTVAALPSNNGALVAYTSGTSVYGSVVVYP